ncbi:flap endonuclease 1 [Bombina bombina]|uniref:flap endonuclease 1 n=1 Tax=Bombina bombina TaxID=8345 RepID=UPI00235A5376|nr:flap endonuclease 1 [Bombina bombina]
MKLKMSHEQFVDLCILLGCDYSGKIRGLGPKKALRMMQEHGSIERILGALSPQKQTFSGDFPYVAVRQLFLQPDVVDVKSVELLWQEVNKEAVVQFLTNEKHIKKIDVRLDKLCARGQSKKRKHVTAPVSPSSDKQKKMTYYYAVKKSVT